MKPVKVKFDTMEDCQRYVLAVENYPFSIDLQCGRLVIDGKSMLGILGFGLRRVLELRLHTEDQEAINEILDKLEFCICSDEVKIAI